MNRIGLRRAATRTLRAGIIKKHQPGERRDHRLARLEVIIERSRRHHTLDPITTFEFGASAQLSTAAIL